MRFIKTFPSLLVIMLFVQMVIVFSCVDQTKTDPIPNGDGQWFCSVLSDMPTDPTDSTEAHQRAVGYKDKWWPVGYKFKVGFMGNYSATQTNLVKQAAAEWAQVANVSFEYPAAGPYDIRIAFNANSGAWSYVGTDCKSISQGNPTMNLGWLAKDAYLHELGHTLGLLHEHQNPTSPIKWNEAAVIKDLSGPPNNWTEAMIRFNVLNPYPLPNVITTALDKTSIMMYPIPARWTLDGFSSPGGQVLSGVDKTFIATRYPFVTLPPTGSVTLSDAQIKEWLARQEKIRQQADSIFLSVKQLNEFTKKATGRQ